MTRTSRKQKYQIAQKRRRKEKAQLRSVDSVNSITSNDASEDDDADPGQIDPSFFMRMVHQFDQKRNIAFSDFHDPVETLPVPFIKTDISPDATSGRDRGLCSNCAGFDWTYHLISNRAMGPKKPDGSRFTSSKEAKLLNKYGREVKINSWSTRILLPRLAIILANQDVCTFCSLLACTIRAEATQSQIDHIMRDREPVECTFLNSVTGARRDGSVLHVRMCSDQKAAMGSWDVIDLRFTLQADHREDLFDDVSFERYMAYSNGREVLNQTQINLSVMCDWWQTCSSTHGSSCQNSTSLPLADRGNANFRVIDVKTNQIIVAKPGCVYVALSYVWGDVEGYKTLASDKVEPENDSACGKTEECIPLQTDRLPQTIKDAITVVRIIGERFLWVDALCIVQDDEIEKMASISAMDQIYRCAALTIIAASGADANAGLVGVNPGSRNIQSLMGTVEGIALMRIEPEPEIDRAPWATRAWTYQEEQLSTRALVFAHGRVYYQCKESSYGEARPSLKRSENLLKQEIDRKSTQISHNMDQAFYEYTRHVRNFTSRKLKYSFDILNAIEGVMGDLFQRHSMINAWGLPLSFLMFALSWQRDDPKIGLKRRLEGSKYRNGLTFWSSVPTMQRSAQEGPLIPFPSWSWAGWEGAVKYDWFDHPRVRCFQNAAGNDTDIDNDNSAYQYLGTGIRWPWNGFDESSVPFIAEIFETGILEFETRMGTLQHEDVQEYHERYADDDSCNICAGGTAIHKRDLIMDDGALWTEGTKTAIYLHDIGYGGEDYCSYTVLLVKQDHETGIWYREGIMDLQPREWRAAKAEWEKIRLG